MSEAGEPVTTGLRVSLLGPPRVELDGQPASVDTRKAIATLAYLALTGRPQPRETLADLLWPDSEPARAKAALRRTLSVLNKALGGRGLFIDRRIVRVVPDEMWFDVVRFRELVADGGPDALLEAVELSRGDLLAGFGVRDSPDFDDWQMTQADGLRRELGVALERLTAQLAERGDFEAAIRYAHRLLELDPLHEPAHRRLMELYARTGDRTAALRQYRECVAVLARELGVAPVGETSELYEAIREDRLEWVPITSPLREIASPEDRLPLVGRDAELAELVDVYDSISSDGQVVLVEGEAGIGKTRLATELLEHASKRGARIFSARCHEGEAGLAYGPISELVRGIASSTTIDDETMAEVGRLLPGRSSPLRRAAWSADRVIPVRGSAARTRFFEAILTVLDQAASGGAPGVLFVDDVQWADEASVQVLSFVARRLAGRPMLLMIATRREGAGVTLLRRLRTSPVVHLDRLTREAIAELAAGFADVDGSVVDRLLEETEGVAFFVASYLSPSSRELDWEVPPAVRDAVEARTLGLSDVAAQALTAAAVVGRSFDAETLQAASGRGEEETVVAIEELIGRGLIVELGAATYDFSHHKIRGVVLDRTTPARARLLHRRVAKALGRGARRDRALSAIVAWHFREAGEIGEAVRHYRSAGDHARQLYANAEALAHYRDALALGTSEVPELREAIADLQVFGGDYRGAISSYEAALALGGDVASLEHKLGNVHHRQGAFDIAASHLDEAAERAVDDAHRARIEADRALNAHRAGRDQDAAALAHAALERAEATEDRRALAQAHNILGMLAARRGALNEARQELERSLSLAQRLGDLAVRTAALNNLALALRAEGNTSEALHCAERALELCARVGDRHREAALHSNIADILRDAGRDDEAIAEIKLSAEILAEVGPAEELRPEIWKLVEW